ncbi:hypothetical protein [Streptomyces sp. NPDC005732]|uniref:hypothetical protein n=1 Tax=Streptomyces sp. NPDC005732 TaxID=3157057 RepID=UPI0033F937A3
MGRHRVGKAAVFLAVTVAGVSGCGGSDGGDEAKPAATSVAPVAKAKRVPLGTATKRFRAMVDQFDLDGGCVFQEPGKCWDQMKALMESARTLRTAMGRAEVRAPEFWSGAYVLIDRMEKGIAVGKDQGATAVGTNRDLVVDSAYDLSSWLEDHPVYQ